MSVIEAKVQSKLVDLISVSNYVIDRFVSQREPMERGDRITIPDLPSMTVYADGSVARQAADRNNPTPNELVLIVDKEPWIPVQLPYKKSFHTLNGTWAAQVAEAGLKQLKNHMDTLLLDDYITGQLIWLASGAATYHFNVEGDGLEPKDFLLARGMALRSRGTVLSDLLAIMDPLAGSAVMGFPGWKAAEEQSTLGPQNVGRIFGVNVVETQTVRLQRQFAIATAACAGGTMTVTFLAADAPGATVGQLIRSTGLDAGYNNTEAVQIATVSADGLTITYQAPVGAADNADVSNAALDFLIIASAINIIVDKAHVHQSQQRVPSTRTVADPDTTGEILQIACLAGFKGRAGRAFGLHSPEASV